MRRRLLFATAALIVLAVAAQGGAATSAASPSQRKPVLATTAIGLSSRLFLADPVSLKPVTRQKLELNFNWEQFARSADGSVLALSRPTLLRFVSLKTMRFTGTMRFSGAYVRPLGFISARTAIVQLNESLAAIDVRTHRILWRRPLDGTVLAAASTSSRVVVLIGTVGTIGPARLIVAGPGSAVRSVSVDRVLAGTGTGSDREGAPMRGPGLAVDAAGNRAYVVGPGAPVAQVDLSALTVAYHGDSRSFAKGMTGPTRQALWLGNGSLAVAGIDTVTDFPGGTFHEKATPSGLWLVDTETWSTRRIQADAAAVARAGHSLLAYGTAWETAINGSSETGYGLSIYALDGTQRAHLFGTTSITDVRVQGDLAYVTIGRRIAVVDADAGRVIANVTRPTLEVLAPH